MVNHVLFEKDHVLFDHVLFEKDAAAQWMSALQLSPGVSQHLFP